MSQNNLKNNDSLTIAGHKFNSRLIIGTGKYKSFQENKDALVASGAEIITVALRRVNVLEPKQEKLQDVINPKEYVFLPNTAGCYSAEDAVRTLRLAREAGGWNLIKLEVIGNSKNLFPDMEETLQAAKTLLDDGFEVMVYSTDDPIYCQKLEDLGCCAIMPLAAPIGSGLGIQNKTNLRIIIENAKVPVIVDAGVGTASDATIAMEMGCDAVLMNTAIAEARNPILMAEAMKQAVESGRSAYLAGRMPKRLYASASSPSEGLMDKVS
ncbi:MAG: thiazole synthase [Rickettsiales bacterium]|jgi:thiazole synthase|nr:thiazole synthase [Rickettsiales bacterium]